MHAIAAHGYHLLLRAARITTWPVWRPLLAALAVAGAVRMVRSPRVTAVGAALAALAGWMVVAPPTSWPLSPIERLPGLAALMLGLALMPPRTQASWPGTSVVSVLAAWWLRGAPASLPELVWCLPVFLGLLAGLAAARALAQNGTGWSTLAAALALAASLRLTGGSPHWAVAALVVAIVAAASLGGGGPVAAIPRLTVCTAAAALVASDRGRLLPVDAACLTPFLTWTLAAVFAKRLGSVAASAFAALLCVSLARMTAWF